MFQYIAVDCIRAIKDSTNGCPRTREQNAAGCLAHGVACSLWGGGDVRLSCAGFTSVLAFVTSRFTPEKLESLVILVQLLTALGTVFFGIYIEYNDVRRHSQSHIGTYISACRQKSTSCIVEARVCAVSLHGSTKASLTMINYTREYIYNFCRRTYVITQ